MSTSFDAKPVGQTIEFRHGPLLGEVQRTGADRIDVVVSEVAMIPRVTVSDLVAFPVTDGYVIGIVETLTREDSPAGDGGRVMLRALPVGTLHTSVSGAGSFRPGAATHPTVDSGCHLIDGEQLSAFMGLLGSELAESERLTLGRFVAAHDTVAVADGNRLLQRHLAILGNTGAGKSWTVALLLERAAQLQHANAILLDLHGEYEPLTRGDFAGAGAGIRGLRIAGPADQLYIGDDVLHLPFWLLEVEELMSLVLNEADEFASDQRMCLTDHVQTLKRSSLAALGHTEQVTTATADSPVPYDLEDLIRWLKQDDVETIVRQPTGKVDPGPYAGKLGGLISRIESRAADPRYGFIFHPPELTAGGDWLVDAATKLMQTGAEGGIKAIDLSQVPALILPMVAGVLVRFVYNVQFWMPAAERTPICIVCDEAHLYMPVREASSPVHRVALDAFEEIAKEGRKYGVCLAVVSQRPSDVSRTILSQCNNFIVMRLTNDEDQDVVERLVPGALSGLTATLPMLDVGEAVVIGDAILLPVRIKLDTPNARPASVTLPYWELWATKASSDHAIATGVESLRTQWRPEE